MTDLREIYQEMILDHYRKPRNFSELEDATQKAHGHNPLCGDRISIYLVVEDGIVREASFQGAGCAISTASASLMTEAIQNKTIEDVQNLFSNFHDKMTSDDAAAELIELGKLEALSGVRQLPIRIKCATLAWHTLKAALEADSSTRNNSDRNVNVSTE